MHDSLFRSDDVSHNVVHGWTGFESGLDYVKYTIFKSCTCNGAFWKARRVDWEASLANIAYKSREDDLLTACSRGQWKKKLKGHQKIDDDITFIFYM